MYDWNSRAIKEWRELGFYYDLDERLSVNQWRFYGSKKGLQNFVKELDDYTANPVNCGESEHIHLGPYWQLKVVTLNNECTISKRYFSGSIADLNKLKNILVDKLSTTEPGQIFSIDKDFGINNTVTTKFFVMADDFDPASMDELISSQRQDVVNRHIELSKNLGK